MKDKIIEELILIEAVRFGNFTLKSGRTSPVYVDLRRTVSYPKLLEMIGIALYEIAKEESFDLLCGVPYTALPFATAISLRENIPMVLKRKERKDYGTKKMVEGVFAKGATCLIIEDIVTTGSSVLDTIQILQEEGLNCSTAISLIDREEGAKETLEKKNIRLISLFTLQEILEKTDAKHALS